MEQTGTPADGGRQDGQRPKVIYVMGAGRSGSTILGITLGNCEGLFYAGELDAWLPRAGQPLLEGGEQSEFWERVSRDVSGAAPLFGHEAQRSIERSLAAVRVHKWPTRRRLRAPYRRVAADLYRAVASAAGVATVIDTSHYPLRAHELQQLEGIDLYLVYLVRDPQGVVASFNRRDVAQYSKSTLTTNVYLWLTNLLAVAVFLRHPAERRMFVGYEEFLADPDGAVRAILRLVGAPEHVPDFGRLESGVPFQGNRVMRAPVISLQREDNGWHAGSRLTAALQLPWTPILARLQPRLGPSRAEHAHAPHR